MRILDKKAEEALKVKNSKKKYTLITGASKGLGKALALQLAKQKKNLIVLALPNEGLRKVVSHLKELGAEVVYKELDISNTETLQNFLFQIKEKYALIGLINNAGIGGDSYFLREKPEEMKNKLQVNMVVPALLTRILLPSLLKNKNAYILNISSLAAFSPIAYKSVYPATKGFMHQFTLGLQEEYKKESILISIVHPGPLKTNNDVTKRIKKGNYFTRKLALPPDKAAEIIVKQIEKRKKVIYLHFWHRLAYGLLHLLPERVKRYFLSKTAKTEIEK